MKAASQIQMSKFQPTHFDDTVNLSDEHPLKEFFVLLTKTLLIIGAIYLIIGITLEFFITRMSVEREIWLWNKLGITEQYVGRNISIKSEAQNKDPAQQYVQRLFNKIPDEFKPEGYSFRVLLSNESDPNAFALPGGTIVITKGLLDTLETENALVFVLGHELGHFKNRDHLRGMGFGFAGLAISALLAGQDQGVLATLSGVFGLGELSYSRHHEQEADYTGLEALIGVYGHAGGATEFFEAIMALDNGIADYIPTIMSTHPDSAKRVDVLKEIIKQRNLNVLETKSIQQFKDPETL